jgi:hypothetical protein
VTRAGACACDEVGLLPMQEQPCDGTRQEERCVHARSEVRPGSNGAESRCATCGSAQLCDCGSDRRPLSGIPDAALDRHGAPSPVSVDVWLGPDPELALATADLHTWALAHPCDCEALCECDEDTT